MKNNWLTKKKLFQLILVAVVFVVVFLAVFIYRFFANCVFEWPIRWDVGTCWEEQKAPAKQKAAEEAIKFAP